MVEALGIIMDRRPVLEDIYLKLFEKLIKLRIRKAIELEFPRPIFNI